jgi:hypothetical protein
LTGLRGPVALVLGLLATPGVAHAYIDPGTGSLVLQGLIAAVAAAGVVIRGYWYRIKGWFRRADPEKPDPAQKDIGERE